jgi:hypothetical protein
MQTVLPDQKETNDMDGSQENGWSEEGYTQANWTLWGSSTIWAKILNFDFTGEMNIKFSQPILQAK